MATLRLGKWQGQAARSAGEGSKRSSDRATERDKLGLQGGGGMHSLGEPMPLSQSRLDFATFHC